MQNICTPAKILILLLLIFVSGFPLYSQSDEIKKTLAVLDFSTEAVSKTEMKAIVEYLSAELFNTGDYIVLDVSQRETILKEMSFSLSGCADDSCALEVGKLLSAELIVVGTLSKVGSRYLMSVKMLETETSRTISTSNDKYDNLDKLIDELEGVARNLTTGKGTSLPDGAEPPAAGIEAGVPQERDKREQDSPADINIPAISCTAAGVGGIGAGIFFIADLLTNSLPAYEAASKAYSDAVTGSDFDALHAARTAAYDEALFDLLTGGISAGLGAALTALGVILFLPPADSPEAQISITPQLSTTPGLVVRLSY